MFGMHVPLDIFYCDIGQQHRNLDYTRSTLYYYVGQFAHNSLM